MMHETGLLLIGHGASQGGGGAVRRLAERLKGLGRFAQVEACFWKEEPYVAQAFSLITTPEILAVPVFATEGRIAREFIPRELGLSGALTVLPDGRRVHYLHAVGAHPGLANLIGARAKRAAQAAGFDVQKTALMLIAHGNRQGGGAGASALQLAQRIASLGGWAEVTALFLEQEPKAADWLRHVKADCVVALPLLLAEGQHAANDVAPLFGRNDMGEGDPVQLQHAGRRVAYTGGLADDEALAQLILEMAVQTLSRTSRR